MRTFTIILSCILTLALINCSDDDTDNKNTQKDGAVTADTGGTTADKGGTTADKGTATGKAQVTGVAGRTVGTCPKGYGSKGTLCLSLRTDCAKASSEVAKASVSGADMNMPYPGNDAQFTIKDVPDGDLHLWGILDKDSSGCTDATAGDLYLKAGCITVKVSGGKDKDAGKLLFDAIK